LILLNPRLSKPTPRLTRQSFEQIAANYTRLIELRNATVHGVNREAEIRGLIQSLSEDFINHAPEFLGVWEVVRSEYEPLINNIVSVFRRVRAVSSLRDAIDHATSSSLQKKLQNWKSFPSKSRPPGPLSRSRQTSNRLPQNDSGSLPTSLVKKVKERQKLPVNICGKSKSFPAQTERFGF
jgi:hypothetical protein